MLHIMVLYYSLQIEPHFNSSVVHTTEVAIFVYTFLLSFDGGEGLWTW